MISMLVRVVRVVRAFWANCYRNGFLFSALYPDHPDHPDHHYLPLNKSISYPLKTGPGMVRVVRVEIGGVA